MFIYVIDGYNYTFTAYIYIINSLANDWPMANHAQYKDPIGQLATSRDPSFNAKMWNME